MILKIGYWNSGNDLVNAYLATIKEKATPSLLYIPTVHWYGFDNQYHNWITAFLKGDFGKSWRDGQPLRIVENTNISGRLIMNLIQLIIGFFDFCADWCLFGCKREHSAFLIKLTTVGFFILYSLPTFWIGTLLVVFLYKSGIWYGLVLWNWIGKCAL